MNKKYIAEIYTLSHPKTKEVFYVGCTKVGLRFRLYGHIYGIKKGEGAMYQYLKDEGIIPVMTCIQTLVSFSVQKIANTEKYWIKKYIKEGAKLFNQVHALPNKKLATIKITKSALDDLRRICEITGEKQYEVVSRLAKEEKIRIVEEITQREQIRLEKLKERKK